jgi:hypothetical protein
MIAVEVEGVITADGKLELELPEAITPGKVRVRIERDTPDEIVWTDEELAELLQPAEPKTGAEIVARILAEGGGWEDKGITDSEAWVQEQRRKRRERHSW